MWAPDAQIPTKRGDGRSRRPASAGPPRALDRIPRRSLRRFLRATADDGRTVLVSSHLLAEVARTADRIVVISEGRLCFDGDLTELAGQAGPGDADALENAFLRLTIGEAA